VTGSPRASCSTCQGRGSVPGCAASRAPAACGVCASASSMRIRLDADVVQSPPPDPAPVRARPKSGAAPYLDYDDDELQPLPSLPDDWRH
jgi:hypothetical protein